MSEPLSMTVLSDTILPPVVVPTCEQMAAAAVQTLSALPADRSGAVHWDHVNKVLYVPVT